MMEKNLKVWFFVSLLLHLTILIKLPIIFFGTDVIHMLALYLASVIGFTWFDYIGFHIIITKKYDRKIAPKVIYRITQTIVQWSIAIYVWTFFPIVAILYMASWWFGVCDDFYYVMNVHEKDWYFSKDKKEMPWLWWTSYGLINKNWRNNHTAQAIAKGFLIFSILSIPFFNHFNILV